MELEERCRVSSVLPKGLHIMTLKKTKNEGVPCAGQALGPGTESGLTYQGSADASGQTLASPVWLSLH